MSTSGLATIRDYIRWAMSQFSQAQLFSSDDSGYMFEEARSLVLGSLHLPDELSDKYLDCNLHADEHKVVQAILRKRIEQRIPAAYLLGQIWFAGMLFKVDERVMVPRSPLAELIALQFEPWLSAQPLRILDLCSGSGCLGILCALEFSGAQVILADVSSEALQVAEDNIALHQLAERVSAQRSDLLSELAGQRFDLIVCKPPYLAAAQRQHLAPELQYEPELSSVAGADGLDYIQRILTDASEHLSAQGLLVLEVGPHRRALIEHYPQLDFIWLEHSQAGTAVLALTAQQCMDYHAQLKRR